MRKFRTLKVKTLMIFCRELGILLQAGISLTEALQIMADKQKTIRNSDRIYREVLRKVRQGLLLSEAMESMKPVFPVYLIQMFQAAEEQGNLPGAANAMAVHFQKDYQIHEKIKSAVWYPNFYYA